MHTLSKANLLKRNRLYFCVICISDWNNTSHMKHNSQLLTFCLLLLPNFFSDVNPVFSFLGGCQWVHFPLKLYFTYFHSCCELLSSAGIHFSCRFMLSPRYNIWFNSGEVWSLIRENIKHLRVVDSHIVSAGSIQFVLIISCLANITMRAPYGLVIGRHLGPH